MDTDNVSEECVRHLVERGGYLAEDDGNQSPENICTALKGKTTSSSAALKKELEDTFDQWKKDNIDTRSSRNWSSLDDWKKNVRDLSLYAKGKDFDGETVSNELHDKAGKFCFDDGHTSLVEDMTGYEGMENVGDVKNIINPSNEYNLDDLVDSNEDDRNKKLYHYKHFAQTRMAKDGCGGGYMVNVHLDRSKEDNLSNDEVINGVYGLSGVEDAGEGKDDQGHDILSVDQQFSRWKQNVTGYSSFLLDVIKDSHLYYEQQLATTLCLDQASKIEVIKGGYIDTLSASGGRKKINPDNIKLPSILVNIFEIPSAQISPSITVQLGDEVLAIVGPVGKVWNFRGIVASVDSAGKANLFIEEIYKGSGENAGIKKRRSTKNSMTNAEKEHQNYFGWPERKGTVFNEVIDGSSGKINGGSDKFDVGKLILINRCEPGDCCGKSCSDILNATRNKYPEVIIDCDYGDWVLTPGPKNYYEHESGKEPKSPIPNSRRYFKFIKPIIKLGKSGNCKKTEMRAYYPSDNSDENWFKLHRQGDNHLYKDVKSENFDKPGDKGGLGLTKDKIKSLLDTVGGTFAKIDDEINDVKNGWTKNNVEGYVGGQRSMKVGGIEKSDRVVKTWLNVSQDECVKKCNDNVNKGDGCIFNNGYIWDKEFKKLLEDHGNPFTDPKDETKSYYNPKSAIHAHQIASGLGYVKGGVEGPNLSFSKKSYRTKGLYRYKVDDGEYPNHTYFGCNSDCENTAFTNSNFKPGGRQDRVPTIDTSKSKDGKGTCTLYENPVFNATDKTKLFYNMKKEHLPYIKNKTPNISSLKSNYLRLPLDKNSILLNTILNNKGEAKKFKIKQFFHTIRQNAGGNGVKNLIFYGSNTDKNVDIKTATKVFETGNLPLHVGKISTKSYTINIPPTKQPNGFKYWRIVAINQKNNIGNPNWYLYGVTTIIVVMQHLKIMLP